MKKRTTSKSKSKKTNVAKGNESKKSEFDFSFLDQLSDKALEQRARIFEEKEIEENKNIAVITKRLRDLWLELKKADKNDRKWILCLIDADLRSLAVYDFMREQRQPFLSHLRGVRESRGRYRK